MGSKYSSSIYGWESSYYGGYERVVYDHPSIYIPSNMTAQASKSLPGVGFYILDKMVRIFVYRVNKYNLTTTLLLDCRTSKQHDYFTKKESTVVSVSKTGVELCLDIIDKYGDDLKNLFVHYRSILLSARIEWVLNDDNKKDGDKEGGEMDKETLLSKVKSSMSEVKEQKSYSYSSSSGISGEFKENTKFVNAEKVGKWNPNAKEKLDANNLVRLLDISFDPKDDRIENLKCGKMSGHKIAEIPAGNTHVYHRVEENISTKPFSVCILADESGSMHYHNLVERQQHIIKMLYEAFSQIIPKDKIYVYGHTGDDEPEVHVYHDKYHPEFEFTIDSQFDVNWLENYDGPVIENIYERVRKQTSDNIIFIAISDGQPAGNNYGGDPAINELKRIIEKCKRDGFVTAGVGLQYGQVKDIYNYHTVILRDDDYIRKVSTLVNNIVKSEFKD